MMNDFSCHDTCFKLQAGRPSDCVSLFLKHPWREMFGKKHFVA